MPDITITLSDRVHAGLDAKREARNVYNPQNSHDTVEDYVSWLVEADGENGALTLLDLSPGLKAEIARNPDKIEAAVADARAAAAEFAAAAEVAVGAAPKP